MPKDNEIKPINASFDKVAESMVKIKPSPTLNFNKNNELGDKNMVSVPAYQMELFHVEKQVEINGIEMGVLENGVPYLTESGLARMCGIDRKVLNRLAINWAEEKHRPRGKQISDLLVQFKYLEDYLFLKSEHKNVEINAYTEPVCLALLEYYAFLADEKREQAQHAFRVLARTKFREFVYEAVGYAPEHSRLDGWQHFHDRVDMNLDSVPYGYFSIFKEIAGMIVALIRSGVAISDKVIPDLSVGKVWSAYWKANELAAKYEERVKYDHNYPEYYKQALSNPQEAWAYPDTALAEFRAWFRQEYIVSKFPKYMLGQSAKGKMPTELAHQVIDAIVGKTLENK